MNMRAQRICTYCVMDTTAQDIVFDDSGRCNYCLEFERISKQKTGNVNVRLEFSTLGELVKRIKADGVGKPYDCIVGVSGGVDSSWVLVNAVELGLRPLAVHMDNGWNSAVAVRNIGELVGRLGVTLETYVINWDEYRSLMNAFFSADVIDVELLYDNALHKVCYQQASKHNLKFILSGSNFATEGLRMPPGWAAPNKWDGRNISAIASRFGKITLKSFPRFTTTAWLYYTFVSRIRWVPFLDYLSFNKEFALLELETKYGYTRYPYKHYESVFTRFYQGFILPNKFHIDKRRVHLSSLVASGQVSRLDATKILEGSPYGSDLKLAEDRKYFLKKMGWSERDLVLYLSRAPIDHAFYSTDMVRKIILFVVRVFRRF